MAATLFASCTRDHPQTLPHVRGGVQSRQTTDQAAYATLNEKSVVNVCTVSNSASGASARSGNYRQRAPDHSKHQIVCCSSKELAHANCAKTPIGVPQCAVPRSAQHFSVAIQGIVSPTTSANTQSLGVIVDDGDGNPNAQYLHLALTPPQRGGPRR